MGRSYVSTSSTAIDNRLAVTDNAFGLSSSGSGNQLALSGHIINASAGASSGGGKKGASGATTGGNVQVNVLDGGIINRAFDFANESLSDMLGAVILGQKQQQASAEYQADKISEAMQQSAATAAATSAASNAAAKELNNGTLAWVADTGKQVLIGVLVAGVAWYVWKKRGG